MTNYSKITLRITIITLITTGRFPALLEIILMREFAMSTGNRSTITTLVNNLIISIIVVGYNSE